MNACKKSLTYSHCLNLFKEAEYGISLTKMINDSEDNDDEDKGKDEMKPQISSSPIRSPPPPYEIGFCSYAHFIPIKIKVSCSFYQTFPKDR